MTKHILERDTIRTSRLLDFVGRRELQAQTGHDVSDWPLVILKELVDNALDACEDANIVPVIGIAVHGDGSIVVTDNGPGLPASTIESILDFTMRVSSREAWVSPSRGAQGNALKTLVAMPFALDQEEAQVISITSRDQRHSIGFKVDQIRQEPQIDYRVEAVDWKKGTEIRIPWPDQACSILERAMDRFLQIAKDYCWLNPNLSMTVDLLEDRHVITATDEGWSKWKTSDPTSPHWYSRDRQVRLIAALLSHDADNGRGRTLREFVGQFRGFSGSAKQKTVLDELDLLRAPLTALVRGGAVDENMAARLFAVMAEHSAPVKPKLLGSIGRDHLFERCMAIGADMETFQYRKAEDYSDDGLPFITETAFAYLGETGLAHFGDCRSIVTGINWSACINNPFRTIGGYGQSLDTILAGQRCTRDEPVVIFLHVSCPRVEYLDRGKSSVVLS
ncbi:Type 2 DNA topoisomerase 6 subunit B [Ensifer sp. M14]|uniref:ATP-binding protein n=1 Tax=Ensifer sp. M14 TaxID=2203782 RepID=UPI000E1D762F|nr:ATP-binding protein [Ensifer sp. M14]RDL51840.1 Type 2 DNA topoisomerase 6 subunit B [Ensifer sp. M14]